MAVITKGTTFANGDQVTALKLNNLADDATFASGAVDNVSTQLSGGGIIVKDGGVSTAKLADTAVTTAKITDGNVTTAKIADSNVTTAKIADSNVTKAKIENVADMKVLGNTSGSATAPQEVSILDEDDMSSDSATALATQQSIKAYVDNNLPAPTNHIVAVQDFVTTINSATINYDSVTGDNVSNASGVLTITGAGVWALTCAANLVPNGGGWQLRFKVNNATIISTGETNAGVGDHVMLGGTTFYTSTGSFDVRLDTFEAVVGSSASVYGIRVEAIKLA